MRVLRETVKALLITAGMAALLLVLVWKIRISMEPKAQNPPAIPPPPAHVLSPPSPLVHPIRDAVLLAHYTLIDLGTPSYDDGPARAFAVNNRGQVVGMADDKPFLWEKGQNREIKPDSDPQMEDVVVEGSAEAINDHGEVAGRYETSLAHPPEPESENQYAYLLYKGQMLTYEDAMAIYRDQQAYNDAAGLNDHDDLVGYSALAGEESRAILWDHNGRTINLGALPAPNGIDRISEATAINNHVQVVGSSSGKAFLWECGRLRSLGPGGANAINDQGEVVGFCGNRACTWVHRRRRYLPMPAGCKSSEAMAINRGGDVAGDIDNDAALWSHGRVVDLNKLVPASAGWYLAEARGMNDHGWIVGYGTHMGEDRAFVLIPRAGN